MQSSTAIPSPSRRTAKRVKPPPKHDQTEEALKDTFRRLSRAIEEIQRKNASKLSFEVHYRYAYLLVLHKQPEMLYNGVTELIIKHLNNEARHRVEPAFPTVSLLSSAISTSSTSHPVADSASGAKHEDAIAGPSSRPQRDDRLSQAMEGETFLTALKGAWEDHKHVMRKLRDILKYMDKVYTEAAGLAKTYTLGLHAFLTTLLRNPEIAISNTVLSVSLALIRLERDGEVVSRSLLSTLTSMLCELREVSVEGKKGEGESVYKSYWESEFLESTRQYYRAEAEYNLEHYTTSDFLARVDRRLKEELERTATYLHPSTEPLLLSILDVTLIGENVQMLLANPTSGIPFLLAEENMQDLGRMYRLLGRVGDGHALMTRAIKAWTVEQGARLSEAAATGIPSGQSNAKPAVGDADDDAEAATKSSLDKGKARAEDGDATSTGRNGKPAPATSVPSNNAGIEWVTSVLALKDKMDRVWAESFEKDRLFQNAINDAFVTFINQVKKSPEYISIFLDEMLKKGLKGKNEAEVETLLDKTIVLFRYLTDKDVFEDYYKRHLARRLYFGRSVSDDAERGLLQKLKLECGAAFVAKAEGMLKDVGFSDELNSGYRKYAESLSSDRPELELAVQICTASFWPTTPDVACILPPQFMRITKSFERYFDTRYTGRKLSWHPEHGSVDVKVRFAKGIKEINLATHGMVVLAHFENLADGEKLSYADIQVATGLPESYLKRTLQSLACAKYKILTKTPASRNIGASDTFSFNTNFSAPMVRIKIATIANRVETTEEGRVTDERVDRERAQVVDAALVRIMKQRKEMVHTELVAEVTSQLSRRFTPKIQMIKLAIERLIEKDYLERDDKNRKILRYLA